MTKPSPPAHPTSPRSPSCSLSFCHSGFLAHPNQISFYPSNFISSGSSVWNFLPSAIISFVSWLMEKSVSTGTRAAREQFALFCSLPHPYYLQLYLTQSRCTSFCDLWIKYTSGCLNRFYTILFNWTTSVCMNTDHVDLFVAFHCGFFGCPGIKSCCAWHLSSSNLYPPAQICLMTLKSIPYTTARKACWNPDLN